MAAEETKKVETTTESPLPVTEKADEVKEKALVPVTPSLASEDTPADDSKALVIVPNPPEADEEKKEGSINRDAVLTRVATEKRLALVKAWEESEKAKAENKAEKKISSIGAWENSKKATIEAELRLIEEKLEKKKGQYIEKMKNKIAEIHKSAEEKRAMIEAKKGEDVLKAEEVAAKYRATGTAPKKVLGCF